MVLILPVETAWGRKIHPGLGRRRETAGHAHARKPAELVGSFSPREAFCRRLYPRRSRAVFKGE